MIPTNLTLEQIITFFLVFTRITAMIALLPIFGSRNIPIHLKAGFSFLLAIILFPFISVIKWDAISLVLPTLFIMLIKEIFIGITIGFAGSFLFAGVQFAGRLIDTQMGFALVQLVDPFSDSNSTVSGQLQVLIFSIIFLLINGHYFMILAIQKSFDIIPLCNVQLPSGKLAHLYMAMATDIFIIAIRLAAPVFSVLVLTSVALGVVARTVPQINIFFVGLPLKIGLGLLTLTMVLSPLVFIFRNIVEEFIKNIWKILYLMA